jgi:hypothetical protein
VTPTEADDRPRRRLLFKVAAIVLFASPICLLVGSGVYIWCWCVHTTYRAVTDGGNDHVSTLGETALVPPDHLVRDGKLYLRVQIDRNLVLLNGVSADTWDEPRIVAFRTAHPDLEDHWPDAERPDGGVTWVRPGP